jgi:hypothetical protein
MKRNKVDSSAKKKATSRGILNIVQHLMIINHALCKSGAYDPS